MSWLSFRKQRASWEAHVGELIVTTMRVSAHKYVWRPNSFDLIMERLRDYAEADAKWQGAPPNNAELIRVVAGLIQQEGIRAGYWIPLDPQFAGAERADA